MRISLRLRRGLAIIAVIVTFVLLGIWTLIGASFVHRYAFVYLGKNVPISQSGGPRPDAYDQAAQIYYMLCSGGLWLVAGLSVALLILTPRTSFRARAWIYLGFLFVTLPASLYNYSQGDVVLSVALQAFLNLLLIFAAMSTWVWLYSAPAASVDSLVLKYMALTLLMLAGILVPALFTATWACYSVGLLSKARTQQITFGDITGLASVFSTIISWLTYRNSQKKSDPKSPMIEIARH